MSLRFFRFIVKPILFLLMLSPAIWVGWQLWSAMQGQSHALGFNPIETVHHHTGDWAIYLLLIGLSISPLARLRPLKRLMLMRRQVGLFAAFYALLHILGYLWLDLSFDIAALWQDIMKRTYITVGIIAFILLVPLVMTSFGKAIKALGPKRWKALHQLVYLATGLGLVHFLMMRKGFQLEPLIYLLIFALLMVMRLPYFKQRRRSTQ